MLVNRTARRVVDALTFWGIVTLAVLSCSAGLANDACACSKSKAYVAAMKSDLRNMSSAQEEYFAAHGRYASDSVLQAGGMKDLFRASTGVTLSIDYADAQRWHARATHVASRVVCTNEGNSAARRGSDYDDLGAPRCDGNIRQRNCRPNVPLNLSVDLWLFAFTVRRRQRKRREVEAPRDSALTWELHTSDRTH